VERSARVGRSFLLGRKKESYLLLVIARGSFLEGTEVREGERRGVADDDHRSSYSTFANGKGVGEGEGRIPL